MKLLLDLYCGVGGWASGFIHEGWQVVGVDFNSSFAGVYPGRFVSADVLTWDGWRDLAPALVVASPPCEEFSRHRMPWTRKRNPPQPDLRLWFAALALAKSLKAPCIIENVATAQRWFGRSALNCGPFHLWGDVPPIVPYQSDKVKSSFSSSQRAQRAEIPFALAVHIARCFK